MSAGKSLALVLCLAVLAVGLTTAPAAQAAFGIKDFSVTMTNEDGTADTLAGSHPFEYTVTIEMNQDSEGTPEGTLKRLVLELPPGLLGNPMSLPRCTRAEFDRNLLSACPGDSQIGIADVEVNQGGIQIHPGVYNLTPTPGAPATVGLVVDNNNVFLDASLRSDSDYGASVTDAAVPTREEVQSVETHIWGLPMAASHDSQRYCIPADPELAVIEGCASDAKAAPFLTLPASCTGPLETTLRVESVEGDSDSATVLSTDEAEEPAGLDGCNQLDFEPSISSQPTTNLADSPSGLDFDFHQATEPPIAEEPGAREHKPGQLEICQPGTWNNKPTSFSYRWLRNGAPIAGANAKSYLVQAEDAGTALQCEATGSNGGGQGIEASAAAVIAPAPATAPPGRIFGVEKPQVVETKCKPGSWSGSPTFAYQWFKDGVAVPGQTTDTFTAPLTAPYTLQCRVAATNAGGTVVAFGKSGLSLEPLPDPPLPENIYPPAFEVAFGALPRATSPAKDVTVSLPEGMALNPSAANGLDVCSEAQIGYLPEAEGIHFSTDPQGCPDASKVGSVEASSPLLDHSVKGAVYVAKPFANPFGSLLAIYLALEDPETGIVAKLGGEVEPDPVTGQLTTTFLENPQLPIEDFKLHIFGGARAALRTPLTCGEHTTTSNLTPWSSPEGEEESPEDSFEITASPSGGCPETEAQAPNSPAFEAGTVNPVAGAFSPFVLKLRREDGSRQLDALDVKLPPGLTGKLTGVPYCPEALIQQAISREEPEMGRTEEESPSCPTTSEVGTVVVGAGAGPTPFHATGHAYLAGPYKGAPLSLVIVTPAVAGPFDLGAVVVRTALQVNPETAQISAQSDPIPQIIEGIPLDVRSIAIHLSRQEFTLNPTSCEAMSIEATAFAGGSGANLTNRFQVGGCNPLPFKPRLSLSLKGKTRRGTFPALKAVLRMNPGEANISRAQVSLPHGLFVANAHVGNVCTRVQFGQNQCPSNSLLGSARAVTPLLEAPLEGPVYLMSGFGHLLPDVAVDFHGQVNVFVHGKVDKGKTGGLRNSFEVVPDAPVSEFTLSLFGARRGLLENSEELCSRPQRALLAFAAHSGKTFTARPKIRVSCRGKRAHRRHRRGGRR